MRHLTKHWPALSVMLIIGQSIFVASSCAQDDHLDSRIRLVVLGIAQDAGYPQAGCQKECCQVAWQDPSLHRMTSCVAVFDRMTGKRWFFDCTPDFPKQLRLLDESMSLSGDRSSEQSIEISGVFLTHAHIGHYTGLMHFGREVMGAKNVPTYCMPRMETFLSKNGPWSQLVKLENIRLMSLNAGKEVDLGSIKVTPIPVPHRDEFSETVGFVIEGPSKRVLYLPDIDKWSRWDQSIEDLLTQVDVAYLDGTFFADGEIPGRDMSLIPHPFVMESITRFAPLDESVRKKVRFIHLNHTNPALQAKSGAAREIERAGLAIAREGEVIGL